MPEIESFKELIRRVRAEDAGAADELWQRFEPLLRREIRLRMRDPRLRRLFDENDVCQSVMASFFVRVAAGQFDLDGPEQLQGLLAQMGRNKLVNQQRRHLSQRRDCRRVEGLPQGEGPGFAALASDSPTPSQAVSWKELLHQFRERLSEEERQLADLRAQGKSWAEIAVELGGSADSRRVQLNRAIARVSTELGLDGADNEE